MKVNLTIDCYQLSNCNGQGLLLSLHTTNMEEDSAIKPAGQLPRRGRYQEVLFFLSHLHALVIDYISALSNQSDQ